MKKDFFIEVINNINDGVYFVDLERNITFWNKGAERITGYSGEKLINHLCCDEILSHITINGTRLCDQDCPLVKSMQTGQPHEAQVFLLHREGYRVPVSVRVSPMRDSSGQIIGAVETFSRDFHKSQVNQEISELRSKLNYDVLTGVRNRAYLDQRLEATLMEHRSLHTQFALLFVDIDHFKKVNDQFGHVCGDRVLRIVANSMVENCRDLDIVGRWGGDEFLVILENFGTKTDLQRIAQKLCTMIENSSITENGQAIHLSISVGAAIISDDDTPDSILKRADLLMYQSKHSGRNRVSIQ